MTPLRGGWATNPWTGTLRPIVHNNVSKNTVSPLPKELEKKIVGEGGLPHGWRLGRVGVHDDGNCWYYTMSALHNYHGAFESTSVQGQIQSGRDFRQAIREHMQRGGSAKWLKFWRARGVPVEVVPSLDSMQEKLANHRTWAELFACVYTFAVTNTNVIFFDMESGGKPYCGVTVDPACVQCLQKNESLPDGHRGLALVAWVSRVHFEPIMLYRDGSAEFAHELGLKLSSVYHRDNRVFVPFMSGDLQKKILDTYHNSVCSRITLSTVAVGQAHIVAGLRSMIKKKLNTMRRQKHAMELNLAIKSQQPQATRGLSGALASTGRNQRTPWL